MEEDGKTSSIAWDILAIGLQSLALAVSMMKIGDDLGLIEEGGKRNVSKNQFERNQS